MKPTPIPAPKVKRPKASDAQITFAHAKFIAAGAAYMALLPKKKQRAEPNPRAIVRGIGAGSFRPDCNMVLNYAPLTDSDACAVLPTATRKQAQQVVSWANLSREQKVEFIAKTILRESVNVHKSACFDFATAILNLIEGPAP